MRRLLRTMVVGLVVVVGSAAGTSSAQAQGVVVRGYVDRTAGGAYFGTPGYYAPPGGYATYYGTYSYGVPRLYSEFASPWGAGYGYGYPPPAPFGFVRPTYGVTLYRPGFLAPGYAYGMPAPAIQTTIPFGVYASGLGPVPYLGY